MKLKTRFSLVAFGMIVFAVATPILVLYARGFQINWKTYTLVKTGAIVARTMPTKATVYLDNKPQQTETPVNLRFLLPKDYEVKIEKEGYQSWSKRLTVRSQFVTWVNDNREFTTLFFTKPLADKTYQGTKADISSNGREIAFLDEHDSVNIVNTDSGHLETNVGIQHIRAPFDLAQKTTWTNGSEIYQYINNLASEYPNAITTLLNADKIAGDGQNLAFSIKNDLYIIKNNAALFVEKNAPNFTLTGNELWYLQNNQLRRLNLSNYKLETIYSFIPNFNSAQIVRSPSQVYLILDKTLYSLNGNLEKIYSPVDFAKWDETSKILIFGNNNEFLLYHPDTKSYDLIFRSLSPLKNAILNNKSGYIFFQNEQKVKAIELDGRDHRNIFNIVDLPDNGSFTVSDDAKSLYTINSGSIETYMIR